MIESRSDGISETLLGRLVWDAYRTFEEQLATIPDSANDPLWPTAAARRDVMGLIADRREIIEFVEATPHAKRDIVDNVDVSRSTVDRAIRDVDIVGLVDRTAAGYTMTLAGQEAMARYRSTVATIGDILDAQSVLAVLPHDSSIQPALLEDAITNETTDAPPYRLPIGVRERITAAERVRLYLPVLATPRLLDCCLHQITQNDMALSLLTPPELFRTLTSEFPGPLATMAATGNSSVTIAVVDTVATDVTPFGLLLADSETASTVSVITYGDRHTIRGVIHNESDAAIQWAEERYTRTRSGTTELRKEPPDRAEDG